ncbi:cell surface protein [Brachyspira intermedia]|uniref:cell surface protein n=1 Tax=Brachyspira intermedia TaxID=84377 RepID=UPI0030056F1E
MKKILLTAIALLTITSASALGMYGDRDSWIDFLVHGNQFRARMDQLGFVLGNGTIKGTFGFRSQALQTFWGNILQTGETGNIDLTTAISAGIGYTSEPFGIGVGYSYTYKHARLGVHTPVLMINALNNNLRIAVPVQMAFSDNADNAMYGDVPHPYRIQNYTGISTDIQIRYYTGIDAFNAIRVYFRYGQQAYKEEIEGSAAGYFGQSIGFETRFYFLNTTLVNVGINPYLKVVFDTALVGENFSIRAGDLHIYNHWKVSGSDGRAWEQIPYKITAAAVLGITANSDIVSLYVEPSLGYTAKGSGKEKNVAANATVSHKLAWGAYAELYIRPIQDLEWYFEMNVNNSGLDQPAFEEGYFGAGSPAVPSNIPVYFETTAGITWYLPSLGGAQ